MNLVKTNLTIWILRIVVVLTIAIDMLSNKHLTLSNFFLAAIRLHADSVERFAAGIRPKESKKQWTLSVVFGTQHFIYRFVCVLVR